MILVANMQNVQVIYFRQSIYCFEVCDAGYETIANLCRETTCKPDFIPFGSDACYKVISTSPLRFDMSAAYNKRKYEPAIFKDMKSLPCPKNMINLEGTCYKKNSIKN